VTQDVSRWNMRKACTVVIVDALGSGGGVRYSSRDAVGCGPRRIAGVFESKGLHAKIMLAEDLINKPSLIGSCDVLAVSAMSIDIGAVKKMIEIWRDRRGDKPAIIGGPIASQPDNLLDFGYDTVVLGEGENSLLRMIRAGLVNGILPKEFSHAVIVEGVPQEAGLKNQIAPFMQRTHYDPTRVQETLDHHDPSTVCVSDYPCHSAMRFYVEVVRGCSNFLRTSISSPGGKECIDCERCRSDKLEDRVDCPTEIPPGCGFCAVPSLFGPPRGRDEGKIIKEVGDLVKAGVRRIVLSASDFLDYQREKLVAPHPLTDPGFPPPNLNEIESLLSKLSLIPGKLNVPQSDYVYMSIENIKPCMFSDEVASVIARYLPGSTIHLGCETGSEEHSRTLGRPSTPKQTLDAVKVAVRHRLRPYVYFIHGLPGQTAKTAKDTVDLMQEMFKANVEKITIYKFKPLPLSAFARFAPALPARMDRNSNNIEKVARRLNLESKLKLVGQVVEVVAAGSTWEKERKGTIAYPVSDGPVVLISERPARQGERLKVRITEVLSDRLVRGERF
jgi:radical SAM superfamily enzyme YgiQ (UPF0313 family)